MLSSTEAACELLARRQARNSLAGFSRYVDPTQPPATHHQVLCAALDRVAEGTLKRLMVFMPPGAAKSTYATVRFPAYYLGRNRDHGVISASYNDDLAGSFGRRVRNLVASHEYGRVFQLQLAADSKARGEWETQEGGFYFSVGVGGGVTGRRADVLIADDLIKGRDAADNPLVRNKTWDWWLSDFRSRGKPGYAIVLIMTRWHEDDTAGRILPETWEGESGDIIARDGEEWHVICVPAEAQAGDILGRTPGEQLWTEYFTPAHWALTKATQAGRNWNCLFQQRPTAEDGTFFRREWFRYYSDLPQSLNVYMTADVAISEDEDADFTEVGVWGTDAHHNVYALDWWTGQKDSAEWTEKILDLVQRWQPLFLIGGKANIEKAVLPFLKREMRQRNIRVAVEMLSESGNKQSKARSFQALQSLGQVYWPNTSWAESVIDQLLRFPAGAHDDKVDACSLLGRFLDKTWPAIAPPAPPPALEQVWNAMPKMGELMQPLRATEW